MIYVFSEAKGMMAFMKSITLNNLPLNKYAEIESLNCSGDIRRRMLDLGIIRGTTITPIFKSPSGAPRAYEVRGSIVAIRDNDARYIKVH